MTEAAASTGTGARLHFTGNALPLFGRYLFAFLTSMLVVPAPWMAAWFSKRFVEQTEVEDDTKLTFEGRGGEIWIPAILLLAWSGHVTWPGVDPQVLATGLLLLLPIDILLYLLIWRWFVASVRLNGSGRISFEGSYWPYLGYNLLFAVSILQCNRLGLGAGRLVALVLPQHRRRCRVLVRRQGPRNPLGLCRGYAGIHAGDSNSVDGSLADEVVLESDFHGAWNWHRNAGVGTPSAAY